MDNTAERLSVREENRRRVEQRIVDAAIDAVQELGSFDFTIPEIAERSGVALRTLYRYFPSRQELVNRLALVADQVEALPAPQSLEDIEPWMVAAWTNLQTVAPFLRVQHQGQAGSAMRRQRTPRHRGATTALIDELRPGLAPEVRNELCDQVLLLSSSAAMFELTDVIGLDTEVAARSSARAIITLIENSPTR